MPQEKEPRDTSIPNQASNKEKAEGSRQNVEDGGGISNRPIEEEQERQDNLPPRGKSRDDTHA
jgi:hypothetical protein